MLSVLRVDAGSIITIRKDDFLTVSRMFPACYTARGWRPITPARHRYTRPVSTRQHPAPHDGRADPDTPQPPIDPSAVVHADDLASMGRRLGGLLVDWAIASLIGWAFLPGNSPFVLGVWALIQISLVSTIGASFGHAVFGMRVVRVSDGGLPGLLPTLVRTVLLALFIPGLVWGRDGRPAHDRVAGTAVVLLKAIRGRQAR